MALSFEQKCATTMIKNSNFLYNFLETFHQWNPAYLYHIYQHRKLQNYLSKNAQTNQTKAILDRCCIAWLDQPLLYFRIDELESEKFFNDLLSWMEKVSNKKVLQYAHKIKSKADPQENLLWFTQKSFQSLEGWFVNELEKAITKNYYNKGNYDLDNYSTLKKLKSGLTNNSNNSFGCKKQLQKLLCCKIQETKNKNIEDFKQLQSKLKIYEDQFYQQISLLIEYEKGSGNDQKIQESLKKRKKKSKKKNKKKQQQATIQNENQLITEQTELKLEKLEKQTQDIECIQIKNVSEKNIIIDNITIQNTNRIENKEIEIDIDISQEIINLQQKNKIVQQNNSYCKKQQNKSQSRSGKSGDSACWSNAQTTKTTKKSGQSHPEFNQIDKKNQVRHKRLSPQEKSNSISKLKRKNRGQRKNKVTAISSWNGDESLTQNFMESYQENQACSNLYQPQLTNKYCSEEPQSTKFIAQNQKVEQSPKKKKKKNNKGCNVLKQLSKKVSSALINKQLGNFIDSLSIQTNNLYDHKIVAFERVRFFVSSIFPTSQALLFGSNAVGLSLPTSDIDIMLFNLPCISRDEAIQILAHLAVQINTMGWIVSCSAYLNAKVPLVKLQIDPTVQYLKTKRKCDIISYPMLDPRMMQYLQLKGKKQKQVKNCNQNSQLQQHKQQPINQIIKVDLTINITQQGVLGGHSTQLMKQWMARYPQIHMCVLALKYILAQRGFSSNFKGGIGSYCLFIMIAAYIREYPELQNLDDGEFFISALKFYGEEFENQIKSVMLRPLDESTEGINGETQNKKSNFISLQETIDHIKRQMSYSYQTYQVEDPSILYNIQLNPLRLFDPINNRIMSGSCHLYPQIKSEFRRIYKQIQQIKKSVQKQVQLTVTGNQIPKMLENKKTMDKWLNKYQARTRVNIKDIFDGGF